MGGAAADHRLKLLLDEMFTPAIAIALRDAGADVLAAQEEPSLRGLDDRSLFEAAARDGRVLVTENVNDFLPIDASFRAEGRSHAGLLLGPSPARRRGRGAFTGYMIRELRALLAGHEDKREPSSGVWWLPPFTVRDRRRRS